MLTLIRCKSSSSCSIDYRKWKIFHEFCFCAQVLTVIIFGIIWASLEWNFIFFSNTGSPLPIVDLTTISTFWTKHFRFNHVIQICFWFCTSSFFADKTLICLAVNKLSFKINLNDITIITSIVPDTACFIAWTCNSIDTWEQKDG